MGNISLEDAMMHAESFGMTDGSAVQLCHACFGKGATMLLDCSVCVLFISALVPSAQLAWFPGAPTRCSGVYGELASAPGS